jgi:hypothetical protein
MGFPVPECNVVFVATLGFLLIGIIDIGCVAFGIVELASGDSIFLNDGLGEVLTTLGTYFTIPYLFILATFIAVSNRFSFLPFLKKDFGLMPQHVMMAVVFLMYCLQQSVTDVYLQLLCGNAGLGFIAWDLVVAIVYLYFRSKEGSPWAGFMYTIMYVSKMGAQWDKNTLTLYQPFLRPNGTLAMLFLCIPIIQFPMYVGMTTEGQGSVADAFTRRFNLFLAHLLHSLDIISLYRFSFVEQNNSAVMTTEPCPGPFKVLLMILISVAFLANNLSILHLFHRRQGDQDADLPFLPQRMKEASRRVESETRDGRAEGEDENASYQRRIFLYVMLMMVCCDLPLLVCRMELWRKKYWKLDIFVAKNLKNILDALMLMMRINRQRQGAAAMSGSPSSAMSRPKSSAPNSALL